MPASEDSFVMLGDDASESVHVSSTLDTTDNLFSSYDGSVPVESSADEIFATASPDYGSYSNGNEVFEPNGGSDRPILPPPFEMESEEGFALREWKRRNAIKLEEKEKREKELLKQIIEEAEQYKTEFYKKRELTCENNKAANREKEKLFLETQEKFYAESNKNYWKAIAELVPKEVPKIEKRRGKKDDEKKPLISVIQGPKPGKPTDLTRMRQILVKLKLNPPPHLKPATPEPAPGAPDAKTGPPKNVPEAKTTKAVTAA